jgi:dipeptidyl aminopeptidase/acylaminoacyl peptidase
MSTVPEGLPPLIDRELFFGNPEISGAELSPDGQYLAFLKPWHDTRNIWVKRTGEPFANARLLTTETKRPIAGFLWTRDGKFVCYVKDNDGDENFNVYSVTPDAPPAQGHDAPESRDLTGLKGVRVQLYSAPKSDPDVVYIGLNDRDKAWHDLYKLTISTGERTLIRLNTEHLAGWFFDRQGRLRLALRVTDSGEQELLRVDAEGFTRVLSCSIFEDLHPLEFHKDGRRAYIETNKDRDLSALMLLDPETGETELVESDPLGRVDFDRAIFSEATDELVATEYTEDRARRYFRDPATGADYGWLGEHLAGRELDVVSTSADERLWLVSAHGDTEPGDVYLFDRGARTLEPQYKVRERLPRAALAAMETIRYASSDGLEIPAYLTLPKGVPPSALPLLVIPHGGPWVRDEWGYNPLAQFFANRGYAVLMPNYRGSTGYGKEFLNAGNGEWGRKMQDDITWGVKHLIARGTADPARIGILGGSYGGYAALAGVAFTPDLYRAAVDIVGPSNLRTLLDSIPPYWEAGRKIMYARMADPRTEDGGAWLDERSPLNASGDIVTPLLVVQGANDPRVNRAEAEQIVMALRDRGFPVEYLLAPDEGHGFARPVNNMALYMAAEKFLARHLHGRYQEGGTPEVVERLKQITVDPRTVTLTQKVDAASVGVPQTVADLEPSTHSYRAKLALGEQEMALDLTIATQAQDGSWCVTETVDSPMGRMTDSVVLEKATLIPQRRSMRQGPLAVELEFSEGRAAGMMDMGGERHAIAVDMGGPLFADGAGAMNAIACLPLAEGYRQTFRNFDLEKLKVRLLQLAVVGSASVTGPAGTFDTYEVEITSADAGPDRITAWIAKESRLLVKFATVLTAAGGAVMTAELRA